MAKTQPGQRIVLRLDTRIALEAILLNRLGRIPTARRQEWLRGLLMQGFRLECLALRGLPEERRQPSATGFSQWLAASSQSPVVPKVETPVPPVEPAERKAGAKPFATLSKVMG